MKLYRCKHVAVDFEIDGNVEKQQWALAEPHNLVNTETGGAARQATEVRLLWGPTRLYAAFHCDDTEPNATMTEFNDKLYEEEVVELFIDEGGDGTVYIEIEVNPLNALMHYAIFNQGDGQILTFARTDHRIETAVRKHSTGWDAEIAIPYSEFRTAQQLPPQEGVQWNINAYRIDRPTGEDMECTAWSPTVINNYHLSSQFGILEFVQE
ncbi:carbohydrate-binding family 9-like protein [Paenibacillus eucommiae]|uniref:Carbohydrate-binding domain-containing protein n=1 Tax=Paenibacillus eucommiae TaxID=1355755 RepID=A0ABS4J2Z5_9BACL|nr:carbohydrate-binding family 9-like protein [Paenibacillus eucommiae]MBP1993616.1 hypothetical protein [Paenibacillus eucommiae]